MRLKILLILLVSIFATAKAQTIVDDFTVVDTDGQTHNLYSYLNDGKIVVLDFYNVGCSSCQLYSTHIQASFENFGCNKGDVIFLGIDYGDTDAQVIVFDSTYGITYPSVSGLEGGGDSVVSALNIIYFTTLLVIDTTKQVVKSVKPPTTANIDSFLVILGANKMPCNVGVANQENSAEVQVLKNPIESGESIHLEMEEAGYYQVGIYDMQGRVLVNERFHFSKGLNILQQKTDYQPGMYILRINNRSMSKSFKLLID